MRLTYEPSSEPLHIFCEVVVLIHQPPTLKHQADELHDANIVPGADQPLHGHARRGAHHQQRQGPPPDHFDLRMC